MKTKLPLFVLLLAFSFLLSPCLAQVPQGFNYQAIARNGAGEPLPGPLTVKITILSQILPSDIKTYEETHTGINPDSHGLFSIVVGNGTPDFGTFATIDWTLPALYLRTTINGSTLTPDTRLMSVPYSMVAENVTQPLEILKVRSTTASETDAIFEVKNNLGKSVFSVYNDGVSINVGPRTGKGVKGGFSVGGFESAKDIAGQQYFFADGTGVNVYIDDNPLKDAKGGFSVGGFESGKSGLNFLDVSVDASGIVNPAVNRILWYPLKNAFLTGNIKILSSEDVGENSFSTGYQAKAKGNFSQSMGYLTQALGNNSTAIGNEAIASMANSYAFGDKAAASATGSYAIGSVGRDTATLLPLTQPTTANGDYAFAIGMGAVASGNSSTALGINSSSTGVAATALGVGAVAQGEKSTALMAGRANGAYSLAAGFMSKADGKYAIALGHGITKFGGVYNHASGDYSIALGYARAYGSHSVAIQSATVNSDYGTGMGNSVTVDGVYATAIGSVLHADSYNSFVIGKDNVVAGSTTTWNSTDPLFVVGNGTGASPSNAFTVLKNAKTGIATAAPTHMLDVRGETRITRDASYDVWIQGGSATTGGNARNLALLGNVSSDKIYLNYDGEYTGGSEVNGSMVVNGNVGITQTQPVFIAYKNIAGNAAAKVVNVQNASNADALYVQGGSNTLSGSWLVGFYRPDGTEIGKIWQNSATSVAYATTSDSRLKENIIDTRYSISDLMNLQVRDFNFRSDPAKTKMTGFLAQELYNVYPEAVARPNRDNESWQVDYGRITPLIVKAIQDQQDEIESLREKVDRLEKLVQKLAEEK